MNEYACTYCGTEPPERGPVDYWHLNWQACRPCLEERDLVRVIEGSWEYQAKQLNERTEQLLADIYATLPAWMVAFARWVLRI